MPYLEVIILGIVEGVTEFLPISSTAHLILASKILNINQNEFHKLFEVIIQSGAILAVLFMFIKSLKKNLSIIISIFFSFLPTAFFGLLFHQFIKKNFFENYSLIIFSLFIFGVIFLIIENLINQGKIKLFKKIDQINVKESLIIGLFQSLALIPGVSRAGIVMLVMMFLGFKRSDSAQYSFFLAVPTIFAASFLDLIKTNHSLLFQINYLHQLFLGFFVAFVTAFIVVKWFVKYLQKNTLIVFGWYRIIISFFYLILTVFFAIL